MTINQLKSARSSKKSTYNTYSKRQKSIRAIISSIDNKLDDDVRDINNRVSDCVSELSKGLKGSTSVSSLSNRLEQQKEKYPRSDSTINSCRANLESEANRCQQQMNSLSTDISVLERQIQNKGGHIFFWE